MATVTFYGFGYNERLCGEIQDKINSNKTISRVKLIDRGFYKGSNIRLMRSLASLNGALVFFKWIPIVFFRIQRIDQIQLFQGKI